MSTFRTGAQPAVLRMALVMAGVIAAATLAHGQVATEAATLAAANQVAVKKVSTKARPKKAAARPAAAPAKAAAAPVGAARAELAPQINLSEGKSTLMHLPFPAARLAVGNARIADVILLNPSELYMLGKSIGNTNLMLWNKANEATIVDIAVGLDTVALRARMEQLFPREKNIRISTAGDTLILSGRVSDAIQVNQIMALASAYVQRAPQGEQGGAATAAAPVAAAGATPGVSVKVVNMLSVEAPQQVMLEVKIAEVSKSLVDQLGASVGASKTSGGWTYSLLSNLLSGNPSLVDAFSNKNGQFLTVDAQKRDGLVKVLAEPTIMAISGQEASFLAGGKIFIPVSQTNNTGNATITLEEKEFGVAVKFTPTVLDGGRINLKVAPEVSELNREGVGITATGVSTTAILPSFTTRRAATTVQLFDGQSFAIGGLIKNNVTTNIKALPMLGEIPVLGALFRSSDFQTDRTEMVFIVTPHLVKALPPDYPLPTDAYIPPSRSEFFLGGKLEGAPPSRQEQPAAANAPAATPATSTGFDLK